MRFNFTLISTFFFAAAVLADGSLEHHSSQFNTNVEKRTNATSDSGEVRYANWAGAARTQSDPSFYVVSGTFVVPNISGPTDSAVGIFVGIDGGFGTQCGAVFQAGVGCIITSSGPIYTALAEWLPHVSNTFNDIEVSPGDLITATVSVASDQTTGFATIVNIRHGTGEKVIQTLEFSNQTALCQLSVEWIVSKMGDRDLANFGVVSFTDPVALGQNNQRFTPAGSVISDIPENEQPVTGVFADENEVKIWYV